MNKKFNLLNQLTMIRPIPYTGVLWVNHKAEEMGYVRGDADWCNLGQGEPQGGMLENAPERIQKIALEHSDLGYGPLGGNLELRKAIAAMYNRIYRKGKRSQYGPENISIASGGRLVLSRLFNIFGDNATILYRTPDYTAYEDLLAYQRLHTRLICAPTTQEEAFRFGSERFKRAIENEHINAFVFSNPHNPTGTVIQGEELDNYVRIARENNVFLAIDEFYSHYIYKDNGEAADAPVSAARYVEDVEKDPVILIDGATKNIRCPGLRISWAVGPSAVIESMNRVASATDGGPSNASVRAALELMQPSRFDSETRAVRDTFAKKRRYMLKRLQTLGVTCATEPQGAFYVWGNISALPPALNDADQFCLACLKKKVMVIPGRFFDIRPHRERISPEPLRHWVRFSYGPSMDVLEKGLNRIKEVLQDHTAYAASLEVHENP